MITKVSFFAEVAQCEEIERLAKKLKVPKMFFYRRAVALGLAMFDPYGTSGAVKSQITQRALTRKVVTISLSYNLWSNLVSAAEIAGITQAYILRSGIDLMLDEEAKKEVRVRDQRALQKVGLSWALREV